MTVPSSTVTTPRRRLGPKLTAFLVLDVVLVAVFLVLLVTTLRDGDGAAAGAGPAATSPQPETSPLQSPGEGSDIGEVRAFALPSGNIHCEMDETSARCTILEFSFERPAVPEGCGGTVGNVLEVRAGTEAAFPCVEGQPAAAGAGTPVLEYGEQSTVGEMTCSSSTNGATCRHNPSGEGFSVARAGYLLF